MGLKGRGRTCKFTVELALKTRIMKQVVAVLDKIVVSTVLPLSFKAYHLYKVDERFNYFTLKVGRMSRVRIVGKFQAGLSRELNLI